jgi:hypothetical protein
VWGKDTITTVMVALKCGYGYVGLGRKDYYAGEGQ